MMMMHSVATGWRRPPHGCGVTPITTLTMNGSAHYLDEEMNNILHSWGHHLGAKASALLYLCFQNVSRLNVTTDDGPMKIQVL